MRHQALVVCKAEILSAQPGAPPDAGAAGELSRRSAPRVKAHESIPV